MSSVFEFVAESRTESGKSVARAIRREGKVPAVIYGGEGAPEMLALVHNEVLKHLAHESVYSHILEVKVAGKKEQAILKGVQRHPSKPQVLHMDFLRISADDKIRVHVPLHCINEDVSAGVKKGGVVTHNLVDIEVNCLPAALPEYIEVDLSAVDVGDSVHLSDVVLPEGVEIVALTHGEGHDLPVVSITAAKVVAEEEEVVEGSGLQEEESKD